MKKKWLENSRNQLKLDQGMNVFTLLKDHGLKPNHYLLDIGCGWLRVGIHIIDYLNPGRYYGFDKEKRQFNRAKKVINEENLLHKKPMIWLIDSPDDIASMINVSFDYMLARSVFTHIDPETLESLFAAFIPFLKNTGVFHASFFKGEKNTVQIDNPHFNRKNEYSHVLYPLSFFENLAKKYDLTVEFLSKDEHYQDLMYFKKR